MWAGVQNVSRPMERCQEISQCAPTMADVTASTEHHTNHGIAAVSARAFSRMPALTVAGNCKLPAMRVHNQLYVAWKKPKNREEKRRKEKRNGEKRIGEK